MKSGEVDDVETRFGHRQWTQYRYRRLIRDKTGGGAILDKSHTVGMTKKILQNSMER